MGIDAITAESVRVVLHAIRYGQPLGGTPLLNLGLVTARLRAEGLADTRESRAWVLGRCIDDVVWRRLTALRGQAPGAARQTLTPEVEWQLLAADLASDSTERAGWGLLYFRYLSVGRRTVRTVIDDLGAPKRTVNYRIHRARAALADALRAAEAELGRDPTVMSSGPVAERVVVAAVAVPRSAVEVQAGLLGAVHGDGRTFRVSTDELAAVAGCPAADLATYRLGRIAEWSQPRYRLDHRFVALTLMVDMGEESQSGRWKPREERFTDLRDLLGVVSEPAIVLLGPPGAGKSTLLRRLELDLAADALGTAGAKTAAVTFLVSLNQYRAAVPGAQPPEPRAWLAERWATRYPQLRPLPELLAEGGVTLLLDGLNEMPHRNLADYRERVVAWKHFLHEHLAAVPGSRLVVACRSLDYSAPLSTPRLRVPQVRMEPLNDSQVRAFLERYSPAQAETLWSALAATPLLEMVRWPFHLRLLVEQAAEACELAVDMPALFTGVVRRALLREVERDNPLFAPGALLDVRDHRRLAAGRDWRTAWDLPDSGALVGSLARLAHRMQLTAAVEEMSQVRIAHGAVNDVVGDALGPEVIAAGVALGVLDEDRSTGEITFRHQLLQEYFAARELGKRPEPERLTTLWRVTDIRPGLREILESLPPADVLPALPATGWEETAILAAGMLDHPEPFLRGLMAHNLVVAGRAARRGAVQERLGAAFLDELRWALVGRSRDPEADLRARIDASLALGWLGDPRYERRSGPHGAYLVPPMIDIPGGEYPIGEDEPIEEYGQKYTDHIPRHSVRLAPYQLGQFPVTNAEWTYFMAAGGYDDERWWNTPRALAWHHGRGTASGIRASARSQLAIFRAQPEVPENLFANGHWSAEIYERYRRRLMMADDELDRHLRDAYPEGKLREPAFWRDERFNAPSQPVVGVCWYEARAYCAWLSAQAGQLYRLPCEVVHEAAQRGTYGRQWAFGNAFEARSANTLETRLKRTSPVGVFVEGDTPEGVSDLCGNVIEWTTSPWSPCLDVSWHRSRSTAYTLRDHAVADLETQWVARGGAWDFARNVARAVHRAHYAPDFRFDNHGFRIHASRPLRRPFQ